MTTELFAFLTFTAVLVVSHCKAEGLPPPTGLSYRWIDALTVNVFWQEPRGLPAGGFKYIYRLEDPDSPKATTIWRNFTVDLLTEEKGSGSWTYLVWTARKTGDILKENPNVSKTIETPKPRAQVKDIKCLVNPKNETYEMNCSWVPGNQALTLSFRVCNHTNETKMALKKCKRPYGDAMRNVCYLNVDDVTKDICMLFESEAGLSTFKLAPMIVPPELSISEEGDNLNVSRTRPKFLKDLSLIFTVCYKKCSHAEVCLDDTTTGEFTLIPYDKSCRYEFRSSVKTTTYVKPMFSEFGRVVSYGSPDLHASMLSITFFIGKSDTIDPDVFGWLDKGTAREGGSASTKKPADETLTVVAIVLPIILSVCILLSCYCFRMHSSILCPVIPDPSVIFKEMMTNGNKDLKTTAGSLYTPVQEPVESCEVDSVTDSVIVPLNS